MLHGLGRPRHVAAVLEDARLGHVELDALGVLLKRLVQVLAGFGQVPAHVVVVVLRQVVESRRLALVLAGRVRVLRGEILLRQLPQRLFLEVIRVEVFEVRECRGHALVEHKRQVGFSRLLEVIPCVQSSQ